MNSFKIVIIDYYFLELKKWSAYLKIYSFQSLSKSVFVRLLYVSQLGSWSNIEETTHITFIEVKGIEVIEIDRIDCCLLLFDNN